MAKTEAQHGPFNCHGLGKYDCPFDEQIHRGTLDGGIDSSGHVEAPTGWFAGFTLDPTLERNAARHYGTIYLVIREDSNGFVFVQPFDTEDQQKTCIALLEEQFDEWSDEDEDQL